MVFKVVLRSDLADEIHDYVETLQHGIVSTLRIFNEITRDYKKLLDYEFPSFMDVQDLKDAVEDENEPMFHRFRTFAVSDLIAGVSIVDAARVFIDAGFYIEGLRALWGLAGHFLTHKVAYRLKELYLNVIEEADLDI